MFYIENLTLRTWLFSVFPALLTADAPGPCYYIDSSFFGRLLARPMGRIIGHAVDRLDFRMIDIRDEKGLLIRLRVAYQDAADVQDDILASPLFSNALRRHDDNPRLQSYLAKSVIVSTSLAESGLWRALYLTQVCLWHKKAAGGTLALFFLDHRPWFKSIERYAFRFGINAICVPAWPGIKVFLGRRLSAATVDKLRYVRAHGAKALSYYFRAETKAAAPAAPGAAKLAVEYSGQLNLDRPQSPSNLFFWRQSSLPAKDLLLLYSMHNDPLTPRRLAEIRRNGLQALATHPAASTDPALPLFRPMQFPAWERGVFPDAEGRWMEDKTNQFARSRTFWAELFARHNIKTFVSWYKYDPVHCAIADALRQTGGVLALYQRALELQPARSLTIDTDIHFSFSRTSADIARHDRSRVRYNVVTGFYNDYLFPGLKEPARKIREALHKRGAKHIVTLLDENSLDDARWHTGHDFQRGQYQLLLEKILSEPWLGLIIKPKVPATLRRRLGPLAELLRRAETTGRCLLLEKGPLLSSYSPAEAALASDLVIHAHLCAGTAALETALAGTPTLLMDREGWSVSPLYQLGLGRVVFNRWDDIWKALCEHFGRPGGIPGFGDWSPLLPALDPFRDGFAAQRMGQYLQWLMQAFSEGLDREAAMARAAQRYAELWGADKISEIRGTWTTEPKEMEASRL